MPCRAHAVFAGDAQDRQTGPSVDLQRLPQLSREKVTESRRGAMSMPVDCFSQTSPLRSARIAKVPCAHSRRSNDMKIGVRAAIIGMALFAALPGTAETRVILLDGN